MPSKKIKQPRAVTGLEGGRLWRFRGCAGWLGAARGLKGFTDGELAYSLKGRNKYERLAARFAVKEAVIKALDDKRLALKSIEVENTASGRPKSGLKAVPGRACWFLFRIRINTP